jgi:C4-dicarboxylate-specific signal transduction histidine kinase
MNLQKKLSDTFKTTRLEISQKSKLLAVRALVESKLIVIDDIYDTPEHYFEGTKTIDKEIGYKSHSFLTVPLIHDQTGEAIGVLQLINKRTRDGFSPYTLEDRKQVMNLSSFATMVILHTYSYLQKLSKINNNLNLLNQDLHNQIDEEIRQNELKDRQLLQQSKMAAMGEMVDAIAHQWSQPLSVISTKVADLEITHQLDMIDNDYVDKFSDNLKHQIKHMTSTLGEFRSFFRPNKSSEAFLISKAIESTLFLVHDEFIKNEIKTEIKIIDEISLIGIENEFKHLILNVINNAKDAFNEHKTLNREIKFKLYNDNNYKVLEISDNAGGIPNHVIDDIFKANVTTKGEGKGTGIGLYMSQHIAQKHGGQLSVHNYNNGAVFCFKTEY